MPTWAATRSIILSQKSRATNKEPRCVNTEVIAPLLRTSPTDYSTLYTALSLTQNISAYVVGPNRRTLITLDFDLYQRGLRILSNNL